MVTAEICRDRAAECRVMAEHAPSPRIRDILLDIATDLDAIGTGSRAVEPDGTAQHAAFQVCSEKSCTKEADPSDPTRTSRYEARATLVCGTEPDRPCDNFLQTLSRLHGVSPSPLTSTERGQFLAIILKILSVAGFVPISRRPLRCLLAPAFCGGFFWLCVHSERSPR